MFTPRQRELVEDALDEAIVTAKVSAPRDAWDTPCDYSEVEELWEVWHEFQRLFPDPRWLP